MKSEKAAMRRVPTPTTTGGSAVRRYLTVAAASCLLLAGAANAASASSGTTSTTWVVHPGESIQAKVDKARSGDTIRILAGTYAEAVCVVGKGLTVKGAGPDSTILVPPANLTSSPCWQPGAPEGQPIENVSALKFLYPDKPVTVSDLQTQGHPESGIVAWGANGFTVKHTKGVGHRIYGILATAGSKNIVITHNEEQGVVINGRSGTAGISVGDSARSNALIAHNRATGLNLGIFVREASGGKIEDNTVKGNCGGILVFDDSTTEKPNVTGTVEGGDWKVVKNHSIANNRLCYAGRDGTLRVSGVGMAVVNATNVVVRENHISDNHPAVPAETLNFPAAGLDVLTVPSPTGGPDPGPAANVRVIRNTFRNNSPLDIMVGSDATTNVFEGNKCLTSNPSGLCDR
jgi:parallel beta-helix repeat protein